MFAWSMKFVRSVDMTSEDICKIFSNCSTVLLEQQKSFSMQNEANANHLLSEVTLKDENSHLMKAYENGFIIYFKSIFNTEKLNSMKFLSKILDFQEVFLFVK